MVTTVVVGFCTAKVVPSGVNTVTTSGVTQPIGQAGLATAPPTATLLGTAYGFVRPAICVTVHTKGARNEVWSVRASTAPSAPPLTVATR